MAIGAFKPTIWTAKLIVALGNAHVYANCCNRDYEGDIAAVGDAVRIGTVGDITIGTYAGTTITVQELFGADQTLVIDQAKYFAFQVDDVDKRQAKGDYMPNSMTRAAWGLAEAQDDYLAALIYAAVPSANTRAAATVGTGATNTDMYEVLVDLGVLLSQNNVPMAARWCVISPAQEGLLRKDPRFVSFGTAQTQSALKGEPIGRAAGFDLYVSNNCPTSGTVVLAGDKDATTLAEQINKVEAFRPEGTFKDAVKGLHLYGAKVTQPARLACCVATPA
jgi:hypothetical protein